VVVAREAALAQLREPGVAGGSACFFLSRPVPRRTGANPDTAGIKWDASPRSNMRVQVQAPFGAPDGATTVEAEGVLETRLECGSLESERMIG
jgi:hypothetical protein